MDPRGKAGGASFEDFGEAELRAFLALAPRETLEWARDAWAHEGRFDELFVKEYGGRATWPDWPASLHRRRARLLAAAAAALGENPGGGEGGEGGGAESCA